MNVYIKLLELPSPLRRKFKVTVYKKCLSFSKVFGFCGLDFGFWCFHLFVFAISFVLFSQGCLSDSEEHFHLH